MNITLHTVGLELKTEMRTRLEDRIATILSRFADRIQAIRVHLEDENGPKGGVDHRCQIEASLSYGPSMIVEARDVDAPTAVDRATRRLLRKVQRDIERRIDSRRVRDGRPATPSDFWLGESNSPGAQGS